MFYKLFFLLHEYSQFILSLEECSTYPVKKSMIKIDFEKALQELKKNYEREKNIF